MRHLVGKKPAPFVPAPPVVHIDRINVALQDRTSWNLVGTGWSREKFLSEMKAHGFIKVGSRAIVAIAHVVDVRFFPANQPYDGTPENCAEFEFA